MDRVPLKLMIPGPIQPDDDVLFAMGSPVQPHYGPDWTRFYNETTGLMQQVFKTHGDVFLMVGSGTSAIDACLGSALSTGEKVLVGDNGFFGDRLKQIAEGYGLVPVVVSSAWGGPLRAADFEKAAKENPDARAIGIVHLETSTAVVNPVDEIGQVAQRYGMTYFVDAVSSLGGLPFDMDHWGVDLCATASQKCLGAPPGLAPVAVGTRGWEAIDRGPNRAHGWYSDLKVWRWYQHNWGDWHPSPVTMATNNVAALHAGLVKLVSEGIETRLNRYRQLALHLREGLRRIGMPPYTPDSMLAPVLTAACGPDGVDTGRIVAYLESEHHIKISGGLGQLKGKIIRIGHMAPTVTEDDLDEVLAALADFRP